MPRIKREKIGSIYRETKEPTFFEKLCDVVGGMLIVIVVFNVLYAIFGG